jgi:ATP-dependent protease ClpP protease subunit/archaellum component FlaC
MKTNLIQIENRAGKLKLNDGVHKESADKLIEELGRLYGPAAVAAQMRIGDVVCAADDALESVEVEINSPGGSVFEGQRIFSALREMSNRGVQIVTTVNGMAASMGSVILMAGDVRRMTKESRIMIHEASSIAMGDARDMKRAADLLDGISRDIANIYADRTGGDPGQIRQLMFAETWLDADAAMAANFVSEVIDYSKKPDDADAKSALPFDTPEKGMSIFARLFPDNAEAVAKLESMLEENEILRADLSAAQSRIDELAPLAEVNAKLQSDVAELTAKLDESGKTIEANAERITELEKQAEDLDAKASIKAAELLAQQGHPQPVALVGDSGQAKTLTEQFNELKGAEATAFYQKHRKAILAEQRAESK